VGVPEEVLIRRPTTDTYSLPQSQDEFYFSLPYEQMDLCLWGKNKGLSAAEVAAGLGLKPEQIERVYKDIEQKRRTTRYLHLRAQLMESVPEVVA
jgi:NAD+ synthase